MTGLQETVRSFSPLGFRFWDAARDVPVVDGLRVTARLPEDDRGAAARTTTALGGPDGVYAFHDLPGMRDLTHPAADAEDVEAGLPTRSVLVSVEDPGGRYQPFHHTVELPLGRRGVYRLPVGSPPAGPLSSPPAEPAPKFYLFSAPARRPPPGLTAVRGTLAEGGSRRPLSHAVVEVRSAAARHLSFADADGRIAVPLPYPPVPTPLGDDSPLADVGAPLISQTWELEVRVFHDPDVVERPLDDGVPLLGSVLAQRGRPVPVWRVPPGPVPAEPPVDPFPLLLRFGREAVLRTEGLSVLLVDSSTSPPT